MFCELAAMRFEFLHAAFVVLLVALLLMEPEFLVLPVGAGARDRDDDQERDAAEAEQVVDDAENHVHDGFHCLASLVQEIVVVVGCEICEVGFCAGLAAERLAITDLLQVVQAAGDAAVPGGVERVERDAGSAVHAGVHLAAGKNRIQVRVHDARSGRCVRIHEVGAAVGLVVRTLRVAVTKRRLDRGQWGNGLAVALELGFALLVGSLDGGLDLGDRHGVGLRDDEAYAVFRRSAVDGLRLPDVRVGPAGVRASDNLHRIVHSCLTHDF